MKRIMVTGACGFIASWLTQALIDQGEYVIGIDDYSGSSEDNLPRGPRTFDHFRFYQEDLANYAKIEEIFRAHKPEIILHLASCAREGASEFQPFKITRTNAYISSVVLELGIKYGMERFVFFSSISVYGKGRLPFEEKMPPKPVDPYGVNKWATEQILWQLADTHKFDAVVIRPHNVIGERQCMWDRFRNVAAIFMNSIMRKEPLYLFGLNHTRAFSYIDDSLPCFLRAATDLVAVGKTINVGGGDHITVRKLAEEIILNMPEYPRPEIIQLPPRPHEVLEAWCTTALSEELLGYREECGWKEGIRKMAEWAKARGPAEWRYDNLPIANEATPQPWIRK